MKFFHNLLTTIVIFLLGSIVSANDDEIIKFITSDGVVYSYAIFTKTIQPAKVFVSTYHYTTTKVKLITLENLQVTSTTQEVVQTSIISKSGVQNQPSITSAARTPSSSKVISTLTPLTESKPTTSKLVSSASTSHSISSSSPQSEKYQTTSSTTENSSISSTHKPSTITLSPTLSSYKSALSTSIENGTCYVYFEDDESDSEYYSTFYITNLSQTIDAATTITSTRKVYQTITV